MVRIEMVTDTKEELEKVKCYFKNNYFFEDASLPDCIDIFCIEESETHFLDPVQIDDDKFIYEESVFDCWDKVEINNEVLYDVEHDKVRDMLQKLRFENSDFTPITLYTKLDMVTAIDEVFSISKYDKVYVVFNWETEDEYKAEL